MKTLKNIVSIIFNINILIIPFLFCLKILEKNIPYTINFNHISLIINVLLSISIISFIFLLYTKKFFNKNNYLKRIALILIAIALFCEEYGVINLVYHNDQFKKWLITTSVSSTKYQYVAKSIYKKEEIDSFMDNKSLDFSNDLIDFSEIKNENKIYLNEAEKEILEHKEDELYKIIKISGTTIGANYHYEGYMAVVYDPSNVIIRNSSTMEKEANINRYSSGEILSVISKKNDALIAMNGGGFYDPQFRSNGGVPHGTVISNGVVYPGHGQSPSYYEGMIGFTKDNKLELNKKMTYKEALNSNYRDAVDFGPFLIIDGVNKYKNVKKYSWATSRTAIGQRADGIVLMLVIDGGQKHSKGACFADLAAIMEKYGAINAANLDGGTSTALTENHKYINSPWNGEKTTYRRLPNAWIVKDNSKN